MKNRKTILITGGTGFLGSHIVNKLVDLNSYKLILLKRSSSNTGRVKKIENIKVYDIDFKQLDKIFLENQIDIVIHTATEYGRESKKITQILDTNLIFPLNILEECIKHKVKLFINTDSYFNKENFSYSYLLDYSLSKKSLNIWLKYLSKNIKIVNMVLEHIYGEEDSQSKFVENMIQRIAIKQERDVDLTYGNQRRDFIYVEDVVNAYLKVIEMYDKYLFTYKQFNIGTGVSTEIRDFINIIKEEANSNTNLHFGAIPYRKDEIMESVADNSEIRNWGWETKYDVSKGIKKIIKFYLEKEKI